MNKEARKSWDRLRRKVLNEYNASESMCDCGHKKRGHDKGTNRCFCDKNKMWYDDMNEKDEVFGIPMKYLYKSMNRLAGFDQQCMCKSFTETFESILERARKS